MGRKKEIYQYIRFFHGALQLMWWHNTRTSDMQPNACSFDSRSGRGCVTTLDMLFTPRPWCLCYQAV